MQSKPFGVVPPQTYGVPRYFLAICTTWASRPVTPGGVGMERWIVVSVDATSLSVLKNLPLEGMKTHYIFITPDGRYAAATANGGSGPNAAKEALSYYQKAMRRDPNYRDVQERVRRLAKAEPKVFHIVWNNKFELFDRTLLMNLLQIDAKAACIHGS